MQSTDQQESIKYFPESVRTRKVFRNLILHIHPTRVRKETLKITHTWGLGGMAVILFLLQVFTGIILRFVYEPSPAKAYDSLIAIQDQVLFGQFVRNIHHLSGMLMVVITFLHLLRVFFTEAFHPPRHWNWVIGLGMMLTVVLSNFSGYLLPWDQLSYWAVTVATSMLHYVPGVGDMLLHLFRGGNEVGPVTLLNFYNFHTAILPLIMVVLMVFHFWKVRKAGGVVVPGGKINENKEYVSAIPDFVAREFVFALVLIALVLFISVIWNAPLLERANPALSPNPAKAPWYFLGIQELLMHFHPLFAAFIIPVLFLAIIVWLPFSRFKTKNSGIWFASDNGRKLCIKTTVFTLLIIPGLIVANEFIPDFIETASGALAVIGNGLVPLTIILVSLALWIYWLSKKAGYSKNEIVQAVFVFLVVSYLILMFTSIWFRGEGMALCWPWEV